MLGHKIKTLVESSSVVSDYYWTYKGRRSSSLIVGEKKTTMNLTAVFMRFGILVVIVFFNETFCNHLDRRVSRNGNSRWQISRAVSRGRPNSSNFRSRGFRTSQARLPSSRDERLRRMFPTRGGFSNLVNNGNNFRNNIDRVSFNGNFDRNNQMDFPSNNINNNNNVNSFGNNNRNRRPNNNVASTAGRQDNRITNTNTGINALSNLEQMAIMSTLLGVDLPGDQQNHAQQLLLNRLLNGGNNLASVSGVAGIAAGVTVPPVVEMIDPQDQFIHQPNVVVPSTNQQSSPLVIQANGQIKVSEIQTPGGDTHVVIDASQTRGGGSGLGLQAFNPLMARLKPGEDPPEPERIVG